MEDRILEELDNTDHFENESREVISSESIEK